MSASLYSTVATNVGGTAGTVSTSDGPELRTGRPGHPDEGVNPEQLLGMAWATCLNATVEAVLERRGMSAPSRVDVDVSLYRREDGVLFFRPTATVSIQGLEEDAVRQVAAAAHERCPVSQLLTGRGEATLRTAAWTEPGV